MFSVYYHIYVPSPSYCNQRAKENFCMTIACSCTFDKNVTVTKVAYFSNHVVEGTGSMIQESLLLYLLGRVANIATAVTVRPAAVV